MCATLGLFIGSCDDAGRRAMHEDVLGEIGLTKLVESKYSKFNDTTHYVKDKYGNCYFVVISTTTYGDVISPTSIQCETVKK